MARRPKMRLTALDVKNAKPADGVKHTIKIADGDGLWLQVSPSGAKSWIYIFRWQGKLKEYGLGSAADLKLADARVAAAEARMMVKAGQNPIIERKLNRFAKVAKLEAPTFARYADRVIADWAGGWKTGKQERIWRRTVNVYAKPIATFPIDRISTEHVVEVLRPLWNKKQDTADRTRARIEKILDAAKVAGLRAGENPARWKGHIELLMPRKTHRVQHHAAMPHAEIKDFLAELRNHSGRAALALEFLLFTTVRTSEVCFAQKSEVDYMARVWEIPAERMKGRQEGDNAHSVPLVDQAVVVANLCSRMTVAENPYIFGSRDHRNPLSTASMDRVLKRIAGPDYTVHGFRSSFRDWAGDKTYHAREVIEAALAHIVGDEAERAYRRGEALEKRRLLMKDWADYIDPKPPENRRVRPPASAR